MKFYGIGVGPGDPELITVKAVKALHSCSHIFTASSTKNEYSLALKVAREYLPPSVPVETLSFPMTRDEKLLEKAWLENAKRVVEVLKQKGTAGFLTMGDPSLFSTFGYLARKVKSLCPEVTLEVIPGITAAQGAAARRKLILAEGEEGFVIASGLSLSTLKNLLQQEKLNIAVYKVYKNKNEILRLVKESNAKKKVMGFYKCGFEEEKIFDSLDTFEKAKPSYFTLLLIGAKPLE